MLDDWFDPQLQDDDLLVESHRQDSKADALLVGRQTFEDFRGYWPKQTNDATGVTGLPQQGHQVCCVLDDDRPPSGTTPRC